MLFPSYNQLHMHAFAEGINLLGSSTGTVLHLKFKALGYESHETVMLKKTYAFVNTIGQVYGGV